MMDPLRGTARAHRGTCSSTVRRPPAELAGASLSPDGEQDDGRTGTEAEERTRADRESRGRGGRRGTSERGEKLKADLDDLLDEIDEVLEDNAEEFVRNYVQKGGQ